MEVYRYIGTRQFYKRHYSPLQLTLLRWIVTYSMMRNLARDRLRLLWARGEASRAQYASNLQMWKQILREGR
jgi:hypothetical protein